MTVRDQKALRDLSTGFLLEAEGITKAFDGVQALRGVSFQLRPGEVHALIGENGAGKSTLVRIITGAINADAGTLLIDGHRVTQFDPTIARSLKIAAIYQQPSLFPDMTVSENIALALEENGVWRRIDWESRRRRAAKLLDRACSSLAPARLVSTLTLAEQQIVEIAKAIGANARVLILDEPTAALGDRETASLFALIKRLRAGGTGIVYISHRLEEILDIADRITVLRDGATIATTLRAGVGSSDLIQMMVGRDLAAVFPKRAVPMGNTLLEVRNLSSRPARISDVSFCVRSGEILGIGGLVGSGRTQLAETLFGITPADSGQIHLKGSPITISSPADAIRHRIGYVPEDRRQNGVISDMPIAPNATLASVDAVSRHGLIQQHLERMVAQSLVTRLQVKAPSVETVAGTLSGGNQQKVALARWLAIDPAVLILDEPTQGIDVGTKSEVHRMMVDLAERGLAIILISSEMPELLGMSDRIAVMHAGKMAGVLSRDEATQEKIMALALGRKIASEADTL